MPTRFQSQSSAGFGSSARHSSRCGQVKQNGAGSFVRRTSRARPASVRRPQGSGSWILCVDSMPSRMIFRGEEPALEIGADLLDRAAAGERLQQRPPGQRRAAAQVARARAWPSRGERSLTST